MIAIPLVVAGPAEYVAAGMFDTQVFKHVLMAGPVVKLVMIMLVVASVVSWAIIFMKIRLFKGVEKNHADFLRSFQEAKSLSSLYEEAQNAERTPMNEIFRAAYHEIVRIQRVRGEGGGQKGGPFPLENVERVMHKKISEEMELLRAYLPFLATTGSATPFVGLFGTVWGIMNAFSGIGTTGNATLATVAPGIAEALVATAAGLVAAIPSVMAYNYFLNRIRVVHTRIDSFTADFINFLERKIERA